MTDQFKSFQQVTLQLSDNAVHSFSDRDIPFYDLNITIYDADVYYGVSGLEPDDILEQGSRTWFRNVNVRDIVFKNRVAGADAKIIGTGSVPNVFVKEKLGL